LFRAGTDHPGGLGEGHRGKRAQLTVKGLKCRRKGWVVKRGHRDELVDGVTKKGRQKTE